MSVGVSVADNVARSRIEVGSSGGFDCSERANQAAYDQKVHEVLRVWTGYRVAGNLQRCDLRFCKWKSPSTRRLAETLNTSCTF